MMRGNSSLSDDKFELLARRLIRIVFLLIGFFIFQFILPFIIQYCRLYWSIQLVTYSNWIGGFVFGLVFFALFWKERQVSIPIIILAAVLPIYGVLFYLLATGLKTAIDE
jgi:hypothetical protein